MGTWRYCRGNLLNDMKELVDRPPLLTEEVTWKGWVWWTIPFLSQNEHSFLSPHIGWDTLVIPRLLVGEVLHQGSLFPRGRHMSWISLFYRWKGFNTGQTFGLERTYPKLQNLQWKERTKQQNFSPLDGLHSFPWTLRRQQEAWEGSPCQQRSFKPRKTSPV